MTIIVQQTINITHYYNSTYCILLTQNLFTNLLKVSYCDGMILTEFIKTNHMDTRANTEIVPA